MMKNDVDNKGAMGTPSAGLACAIPAFPWLQSPLDKWAICGMNHYHVDGERLLFVAMTRDGKCITAEGSDDQYLWNRLCHAAWDAEGN